MLAFCDWAPSGTSDGGGLGCQGSGGRWRKGAGLVLPWPPTRWAVGLDGRSRGVVQVSASPNLVGVLGGQETEVEMGVPSLTRFRSGVGFPTLSVGH